jgi:hypothetical protein
MGNIKHIGPLAAAIFLLSCKQPNGKADTGAKGQKKPTIGGQKVGYSNWDKFWTAFKTAASKKDTLTIEQLTSFPFLQNGEYNSQNDFAAYYADQAFRLDKAPKPTDVDADNPMLQGFRTKEEGERRKIDSLRVLYFDKKEFYFVKVDGVYKLIEIRTPG